MTDAIRHDNNFVRYGLGRLLSHVGNHRVAVDVDNFENTCLELLSLGMAFGID